MPEVRIDIFSDQHGAPQELKRTEDALTGVERQGEATHGALDKLWAKFAIGNIVAQAAIKTFSLFKTELSDTIKQAIDAEKVDRALESSLQIVGQAAGGTAETLKRYASALQRKTVYDDEAIKSAQALIIQMRGTASQVDVLTKGAIGLASVFGMDLQSAARAVAQGFDGNYRAIGMLIPQVRTATTDGEKHAAMMKGLASYYQRAESEVYTFGGKLGQLKNVYDDIQKTAGNLVIQNKAVLSSLEGIKSIILWLDMQAKKSEAGGKKASILDYFGPVALWNGLSSAITATGKAAQKTVDDYAKSWEGYTASFLETRGVIIDSIPIIVDLRTKFKLLNTEIDAMPWGRHRAEMEVARQQLYEIRTVIEGQLPVIAGYSRVVDVVASHLKLLQGEMDRINKTTPVWVEKWKKSMASILPYTQAVSTGLDAIFSQSQTNREIGIENEYKKRLAAINRNVTDEGARQGAIEALEAEYQIKRSSAAAAGAKQRKAAAMMEAVVNTASAVTEALPNFILAAIVAAMGAIQIGIIAAQPIPLARGAVFTKRTRMTSESGTAYDMGEAGTEILAPERTFRTIIREEMQRGGGVSYAISIKGPLIVTTAVLTEEMCNRAAAWMFTAINNQLRAGKRLLA